MQIQTEKEREQRSEDVQDIIERMPNKFGFWVTGIVVSLLFMLFLFGWIIQYPDTVSGQITINAKYSPVKLVAAASGNLILFDYRSKEKVEQGNYIAVIQNSADVRDILKIKTLLDSFKLNRDSYKQAYRHFPDKVSLGGINSRYYTFLGVLHKIYNNEIGNSFHKQEEGLQLQISQLSLMLFDYKKLEKTRENNMILYKKMSDRDSILLIRGGAIEADLDQSRVSYLNSKAGYQGVKGDINNSEQRIEDYKNKLQLLYIQKEDEDSKLQLDLLSAYDELKDNINSWEQRYAFKSPINGQVDFLKFWTNNQFVQAGEEVFSIIPKNNKVIGQLHLPAHGAGKVKIGQEVIIKLDNYPFQEFGSVKGRVAEISLTTKLTKVADKNDIDVYLVDVELPKDLITNYGQKLDFKFEIKGIAEIVTNKRNLLERFFDNLRYATKDT